MRTTGTKIAFGFLLTVALALRLLEPAVVGHADKEALQRRNIVELFDQAFDREVRFRPAVAFLGDSTMLPYPADDLDGYPQRIADDLRPRQFGSWRFIQMGLAPVG
jgi:hypothetical protein